MEGTERINNFYAYEYEIHKGYSWPVWEKYFLDGDWVRVDADITKNAMSDIKYYQPYFEKSLIGEFAKLESKPGHEKLLKFIHRYGLPNVSGGSYSQKDRPVGNMLDDNVDAIYLSAYRLRKGLELWEIISPLNNRKLKKGDEKNLKNYVLKEMGGGYEKDFRVRNNLVDADDLTLLYHYLTSMLNDGVYNFVNQGVIPSFAVKRKKDRFEIFQGWRGFNLASIAWLQLSFIASEEKLLKRCLQCHKLFSAEPSDRKFCPPPKGVKRSTCENTYNSRIRNQGKNKGSDHDFDQDDHD